ncbi:MAG: [FeFe] hydrogenase H-cluster radical SAM maturase HydE [Holophagales bacterium]|jgi:biotin synthase|nr:[FeFe] hydrogenase H-cluster radical SAM maturase HydE [Holophagales bacterium]
MPQIPVENLDKDSVLAWLLENDETELNRLWQKADDVRRQCVGDDVWLRGLIEVSNNCARSCAYCGISLVAPRPKLYLMDKAEIMASAKKALEYAYGTVVLQAGEDPRITGPWMADIVSCIKRETSLAITLSLGERSDEELKMWREAGADRYLLRFETSDEKLYRQIHPDLGGPSNRIAQLERMRDMGYEIGTGIMIGLPGQTWESMANDVWLFRKYGIDMVGVGPFLESPATPLAGELGKALRASAGDSQVPSDDLTALKVVALTRLLCPDTNIPATTALATIDPTGGRIHGLQRGANVVMPNVTPAEYRSLYQTYPGKAGTHESADVSRHKIESQVLSLGRTIGKGPGTSLKYLQGKTSEH